MKFFRSFFRRRDTVSKTDISQRFDLISRLGTGSMSKVWRAVDRNRVKSSRSNSRYRRRRSATSRDSPIE